MSLTTLRPRRLLQAVLLTVGCWLCAVAGAEAQCTISASGVNFGTYDVFVPSATVSTGTISYRCIGGTKAIRISLGAGSGTFAARTLRRGAESLFYNLFRDAALTEVWGDGSAGTYLFQHPNPPGSPQTLTVYGRIPALQDVSTGSYTDSLVLSIDF